MLCSITNRFCRASSAGGGRGATALPSLRRDGVIAPCRFRSRGTRDPTDAATGGLVLRSFTRLMTVSLRCRLFLSHFTSAALKILLLFANSVAKIRRYEPQSDLNAIRDARRQVARSGSTLQAHATARLSTSGDRKPLPVL